jgi:hypothetical protein
MRTFDVLDACNACIYTGGETALSSVARVCNQICRHKTAQGFSSGMQAYGSLDNCLAEATYALKTVSSDFDWPQDFCQEVVVAS